MKPVKGRIRRTFVAGLLVLIPISITFFLVFTLVQWTDGLLELALPLPRVVALPGLGLIVLMALIFAVGLVATNFMGKKIVAFGERILTSIPVIRSVYVGAKTLVEAFSIPSMSAFRQVVLIEYPRRGMWVLGFVTRSVSEDGTGIAGGGKLNIFIPTSPNPTSGMVVVIPTDEAIFLDLSVREAIEFIVSGGVLSPAGQPSESGAPDRIEPLPWPERSVFGGLAGRAESKVNLPDPRAI
ncbi:DUF502 domain-containing protein [bacterium]|nr:DUF502 domain-containing protein [bacterium]